jgi:hypothetical protein
MSLVSGDVGIISPVICKRFGSKTSFIERNASGLSAVTQIWNVAAGGSVFALGCTDTLMVLVPAFAGNPKRIRVTCAVIHMVAKKTTNPIYKAV